MPQKAAASTRRPKRSHARPPSHAPAQQRSASRNGTAGSGAGGGNGTAAATPDTYQDALKYLAERVDLERLRACRVTPDLFKLDRMRALLTRLGDPHRSLRCVHVAGTKGKGSTCEMTASCLEACGYAVGIYTSPHLIDVRERIRINRKLISHADFTRHLATVAAAAAAIETRHGAATYFEHMTALAFVHFAQEAVDVAVVEVGLGGRLDSTNVITPDVTAITSISLDHTQLLGNTVEKIAREKAGIFKPGVPALTIDHDPGTITEVLRDAAARVGAPFRVVGGDREGDLDFSARFEGGNKGGAAGAGSGGGAMGPNARVCLTTPRVTYEHLTVPLRGEHQALNCGLALAILDTLVERGFKCPENKVTRGLERTELACRLEIAWTAPRILLDAAHNPDSIRCLVRAIGANLRCDSTVMVFGCCADKDIDKMLLQLAQGGDKVVFTRAANTPRAADPEALHRRFIELTGKQSQTAASLPQAITMATKGVDRDDLICVTGSFYLVGEAKKYLSSKKNGTL